MGIFRRRKNTWAKDVIRSETDIKNERLDGSVVGDIIYKETFGGAERQDSEFASDLMDSEHLGFDFADSIMGIENHGFDFADNMTTTQHKSHHESEFAEDFGKLESVDAAVGHSAFQNENSQQMHESEFGDDMTGTEHFGHNYSEFVEDYSNISHHNSEFAGDMTGAEHHNTEHGGDMTITKNSKVYEAEFAEDMDDINEFLDKGVTENAPYHDTATYRMINPKGDSTVDTNLS